jgi:hypothetical protein
MGLFDWLTRKSTDNGTRAWRDAWAAAVAGLDAAAVARLETQLRQQPPIADDIEMEEEMLDGLKQLLAIERDLAAGTLPLIDTTHRVVGADRCHFSAPVSLPDDPAQATGRLLLTSTRAVFAGGARAPALPWHGVREVMQTGRDLLFVLARGGADEGQRFRCNSFGEALCGAAIARYLSKRARTRPL